jgi:NIMA (never in mitosis gene a)-related kinase
VQKVLRLNDNKHYAMKQIKIQTLNDKEIVSALNEIRILASIQSPFVLSYRDAFWDKMSVSTNIIIP